MLITVEIKKKINPSCYIFLCFLNSSCPKHFDFYLMYMPTNHLCWSNREYWTMYLIKLFKQMGFPLGDNTQKYLLYKMYLFLIRRKEWKRSREKKITVLEKELVISHVSNFPTELRPIVPQGPQTSFHWGFCVKISHRYTCIFCYSEMHIALGRNYSTLIWVWGEIYLRKTSHTYAYIASLLHAK